EESLMAAMQTAIDSGADSASLLTFDLDQQGQPIWSEIVAQWSRRNLTITPLHTRFHLPDFPLSRLWLADAENPLFVSDIEVDDRIDLTTRTLYKQGDVIATAILPLALAGRWVGLTIVSWDSQREFTPQEKRIYRAIMSQLASVLDRARQFERSELLSSIVENHPDLIGVGTLDGQALYVNPSGLNLLGYEPGYDVSKINAAAIFAPEDAQRLITEGIPAALSAGGWSTEANIVTADGIVLPIEETIGINYDVDGHATSFSMTMRDISERKATEEAIRTSEQLARSFQGKLADLQEITTELSRLETLPDLFRQAIAMGHSRLGFDRLGIWTFDEDLGMMHGTFGIDKSGNLIDEMHLSHAMSAYSEWFAGIMASRERRLVNEYADLYENYDIAGQGWQVTALLMQEDRPLGYVAVDNLLSQRPLQPYEPDLITLFANALSSLMVNKEVQQAVSKQAQELQTVADLSRIATTILDVNELLQQVSDLTKERFNLYHAHIYLLSQDEQFLALTAGAGEVGRQMAAEGRQIPLRQKQSLVARAARLRQGVIANDVRAEVGFLPNPLLPNTRSELATPLIAGEQVLGVLDIQASEVNYFAETDINIQTTLAAQIATAIQNARQYQRTQEALNELTRMQQMLIREGWESFLTTGETELQGFTYNQREVQPIKRNGAPDTAVILNGVANPVVGDTAVRAPLTVRGATIGVLGVRDPSGQPVSADKQMLLASISQQVAEALERARLFTATQQALAETQKRTEELATINQIVSQLGSILDIQQAMEVVAQGLVDGVGVDQARIALFDTAKENLVIMAEAYEKEQNQSALGLQIPVAENELTLRVLQTRQGVIVHDVDTNPLTAPVQDMLKAQGVKELVVLPMLVGNEVIGTVGLDILDEVKTMTDDKKRLAETIIFQAAAAIQNAHLFSPTEAALQEVRSLFDISARLNAATSLDEVVAAAAAPALPAGAVSGALFKFELDESGEPKMVELVASTAPAPVLPIGSRFNLDEMPSARLRLASGEGVLLVEDLAQDTELDPTFKLGLEQTGTRALVFMTLAVGNRQLGSILVRWHEPHKFTEADRRLYLSVATQTASVVDSILLLDEVQSRATELQETTGFLDSVIENLPVMLFVKDAEDLRFVRWNRAGSEITGYPQDVFIGKSDYDFFPPEEAAYFIAKDREVLSNGTAVDIPDEPIQTAHQGVRTLHTRKMPIMDAEGKPKYLLGISEDITERRQFEEALAKRALELQMVAEISTAVASNLDASRLLQDVVDLTRDNFDLYHAHIYLLNQEQDLLVLAAGAGKSGAEMVAAGHSIPLNSERSLVARAARERQGVIANDVQTDEG
ncbi:MAG TPA: GAF domain-containing protein, partial [Chloroflexota bacterium]|nr:GAF domain-containing protein [Chloroflexota bacterium]